jgi:NAD(P)-dependent dehydrogenase (short-subunit alcohol dehydrogenase family)
VHTIVMTGATRGIGRVAIDRIISDDPEAHLVLLAREPGGSTLARRLAGSGRQVTAINTDLLSMRSVRSATARLLEQFASGRLPPLRTLVGNAGLQFTNNTTATSDGLEATFAINVLANHVLIRNLESAFRTPARIVITVSDTHFGDFSHNLGMVPAPRWQDPGTIARIGAFPHPDTVAAGRAAYSTSKLAAIYSIHEFARRLPEDITITGFNPGFVPGTDLARDAGRMANFAMRRVLPLIAFTPLATSKSAAGQYLAQAALGHTVATTGSYIDRACAERSSAESYDPARERQLWDTLEHLMAQHAL